MKNENNKRTMSSAAVRSRREYYRSWRVEHPENARAIQIKYWENKAKKVYGDAYIEPAPDEEMSEQARAVRRDYYAKYHAEYWERKANEERAVLLRKTL